MNHPVVNYLRGLYDIRMSGADPSDPALVSPLARLLNDAGQTLKPIANQEIV